jgi:DNA-binding NarL/FixJ family response regulator
MPSSKTSALAVDLCPLGKHCLCGSLPPRMRQVLHRMLAGDSEKQVALALGISQHTVHEHLRKLSKRFNVGGKTELMALGFRTAAAAIQPSRPRAFRHDIGLTEFQREELLRFLADTCRASNRRITRAKILLRLDGGRNDYDIADELNICIRTIERTRQSFLQTRPPVACQV